MLGIRTRLKSYIERIVSDTLAVKLADPAARNYDILAKDYGFARTREAKMPVSADGSPLPWYTYPAIEYFNQLDASRLRVFEYGSGNSSLYWARKGADVWSVEHDAAWYESMNTRSAHLKGLLFRESPEAYASAISEVGGDFDVIVIDGAWRNECAKAALPYLRSGGIIILDNSDWYTDVSDFVRGNGFFQVDFNGFGPINNYCWTTSILIGFSSPLKSRVASPRPVGGVEAFKSDKW